MITSLDNDKVKEVVHLRDRSQRDKLKLFLIEGYREMLRALEGKAPLVRLFICPELFLGENEPELISRAKKAGCEIIETSAKVFYKMSYRDRPDGLIGVAKQERKDLSHLDAILARTKNPLLVIAEAIEKPGNLGTILRSSDAAGVTCLIVANRCTDIFNPNVVRASCGTLFTVPVVEAATEEVITYLKSHNINILAAMPDGNSIYTNVDMKQPVAVALGTEQLGLSDALKKEANLQVRIPMLGTADSLNVAMATTLILYEAVRQRSG
jgi:TrmH family RNA methyltransferase